MTDEERVRALLGEAFEVDPPASARPDLDAVRAVHRRRRVVGSVAAALLVSAAVVAAVVLPGLRGGRPAATLAATPAVAPTESAQPSPSVPVPVGEGVLADGDLAEASGRVVEVPGKPVRFCGPEEFDAVGWAQGHEPAPAWCPLGVNVVGVDLGKLSQYRTKNGATEGFAYLRGTWSGGVLHVSAQTAPRYLSDDGIHDLSPADCPKPSTGWPVSKNPNPPESLTEEIIAFDASHPGEVVTRAVARPTPRSNYMVIAVAHPAIAAAVLHPVPGQLCIVQSRYTRAQLAAARAPFDADQKAHLVDGKGLAAETGESVAPDGQVLIVSQVLMMTDQVRAWIASAPVGILKVTPWLARTTEGAPLPPLPTPVADPSPFLMSTS